MTNTKSTEVILGCRHVPTLVLDLDGVLVHSDWTRGRGWRTFKRPGVEDFLKRMAPYYEIVVYTSQVCLLNRLLQTICMLSWKLHQTSECRCYLKFRNESFPHPHLTALLVMNAQGGQM